VIVEYEAVPECGFIWIGSKPSLGYIFWSCLMTFSA
jgi:hypothetical protein